MKGIAIYIRNILILPLAMLDHVGNVVILRGSPFETMSHHAGRVKVFHGGVIPKDRRILRLVDWVMELFDKNHLIRSIEHKPGSMGVIDRPEDML